MGMRKFDAVVFDLWGTLADEPVFPPTPEGLAAFLDIEPEVVRGWSAAEIRYACLRRALERPRPGAVETLATLREAGYRTGLVSNCGEETARLWWTTALAPLVDAAVLSWEVGLAKPDQRIYALVARRMDVTPERCLFVGDGGSRELSGAVRAGMAAACMRAPHDLEDRGREPWEGPRIAAIPEVLGLIG